MAFDNRYGPTHVPKLKEKERVEQLRDFGLETNEEHIENGLMECEDVDCTHCKVRLKQQRIKRVCLIFTAIFVLSVVVGIVVSAFMGRGDVITGLLIGVAVGTAIALLPMIVYLATHKRK